VGPLEGFLRQHGVPAIVGLDTRRLTRHLRSHGALAGAFGHGPLDLVQRAASEAKGTDGADYVTAVTTTEPYTEAAVIFMSCARLRHQDDHGARARSSLSSDRGAGGGGASEIGV